MTNYDGTPMNETELISYDRYVSFPFGFARARVGNYDFVESVEDCQRRVVKRFIEVLERTQQRPFLLPESWSYGTRGRWDRDTNTYVQRSDRLSDRQFLELVTNRFPTADIFRFGTRDEEAIAAFDQSMRNAAECAAEALAASGTLNDDERRVLTEWRAIDRPLRYREITNLIFQGRSFSTQESRTGAFLRRFAIKQAGSREMPYTLREGARTRELGDKIPGIRAAIRGPSGQAEEISGMSDDLIAIKIMQHESELDLLRTEQERRGLEKKSEET